MDAGSYRFFDHTADIGIEVEAPSREGLFETAARGLFDLLADMSNVKPDEERRVTVRAADLAELLVRWLSELLYLHDAERLLLCRYCVVRLDETRLEAVVAGEKFSPGRHRIHTEIKAVTYHQATVEQVKGRWRGRVVLDV